MNSGHEYSQLAAILLLDEITLRRYVEKFKEKGVEGLLEYRYTGGRSQLNTSQQNELKIYLKIKSQKQIYVISQYQKRAPFGTWCSQRDSNSCVQDENLVS